MLLVISISISLVLWFQDNFALRATMPSISSQDDCVPQTATPSTNFLKKTFWAHTNLSAVSLAYDYQQPGSQLPELSADVSWDSLLLPPEGGFLMVEENDGDIRAYGVSMFHQLHCLIRLRDLLSDTSCDHHGSRLKITDSITETSHDSEVHWRHCLHYIAQVSLQ